MTSELIGNRRPWDVLFKSAKHIFDQMGTVRNMECWGAPSSVILNAHSALFDAHQLIHECLELITAEEYAA